MSAKCPRRSAIGDRRGPTAASGSRSRKISHAPSSCQTSYFPRQTRRDRASIASSCLQRNAVRPRWRVGSPQARRAAFRGLRGLRCDDEGIRGRELAAHNSYTETRPQQRLTFAGGQSGAVPRPCTSHDAAFEVGGGSRLSKDETTKWAPTRCAAEDFHAWQAQDLLFDLACQQPVEPVAAKRLHFSPRFSTMAGVPP